MRLKDKKVIIVGGSSGIGLATARAAHAEGAHVILVGKSKDKLEKAAATFGTWDRLEKMPANIADEGEVRRLFEAVGNLDHLVTTAADLAYFPIREFGAKEAARVIDSKIWGPFFLAKHGAARLRPGGSLTFTSGVAADRPTPGTSLVSAVNGALEALTRALSVELAPLRVNVVSPGVVDTPAWDAMPEAKKKELFSDIAAKLPARRVGKPEDLAEAILYLMLNEFTTGTVLHVDGGHRLK